MNFQNILIPFPVEWYLGVTCFKLLQIVLWTFLFLPLWVHYYHTPCTPDWREEEREGEEHVPIPQCITSAYIPLGQNVVRWPLLPSKDTGTCSFLFRMAMYLGENSEKEENCYWESSVCLCHSVPCVFRKKRVERM